MTASGVCDKCARAVKVVPERKARHTRPLVMSPVGVSQESPQRDDLGRFAWLPSAARAASPHLDRLGRSWLGLGPVPCRGATKAPVPVAETPAEASAACLRSLLAAWATPKRPPTELACDLPMADDPLPGRASAATSTARSASCLAASANGDVSRGAATMGRPPALAATGAARFRTGLLRAPAKRASTAADGAFVLGFGGAEEAAGADADRLRPAAGFSPSDRLPSRGGGGGATGGIGARGAAG